MESITETKEQQFIHTLDVFNGHQLRKFTDEVFPELKASKTSYREIWNDVENCKKIYDHIQTTLPPIRKIKSTEEIKIGGTLVYAMQPKGTGMFKPEVGTLWEMKTDDDIIAASIEIIERGRGWWPIEVQ
jgi:hypothetical protein